MVTVGVIQKCQKSAYKSLFPGFKLQNIPSYCISESEADSETGPNASLNKTYVIFNDSLSPLF